MKLSLVISTYNNAASLVRTLESVAKQNLNPEAWECVVVNNNSTDDTAQRVGAFIKEYSCLNIRLVDEPQQGLSFARNRGIAESKGEIVAFIDDDETINEEFVAAYIDLFENHGAFAAAGAVKVCYESGRPAWMSHYTEKMIGNPIDLGKEVITITSTITPAGGNMAFNREIFNLCGAFDTHLGRKGSDMLGGEENDIFDRMRNLGERVFYAPNAIVYHHISEKKLTKEYFDKVANGIGRSKYIRAQKFGTENELLKEEKNKRFATLVLCLFHIVTLSPQKAKWLWRMRKGIAQGIREEQNRSW